MSLIDEALKRAREQAERESAAQRSAASRWVPAYPLARRRSRALVWAGLAAACLLLGVGAGLLASRFSGGGEERAGGIELPDGTVEEGGEGGLPPAAEAVLLEDTTGTTDLTTGLPGFPFPPPVTELPEEDPTDLEPRLVPEPVPEKVPPPAPPGLEPVPPPQAEPIEPPAPSGAAADGAETHVRRAPVPGGGWIQLGGIAFSADQPVALLNGRVVSVGEVVEGFTVVSIAPRRVELRGPGTSLVLTLD